MFTIAELWVNACSNEEKKLVLCKTDCDSPITIVYINKYKAIGFYGEDLGHTEAKAYVFSVDKRQWNYWTEPKAIDHWPAVRKSNGGVPTYVLSSQLYYSKEHALKSYSHNFIRLATELPAIKLIPANCNE